MDVEGVAGMRVVPRRLLAPGGLTLLLLTGAYANLVHGGRGLLVDTTRPERRDLLSVVSLDATLEPPRTVVIGAPTVGRVSEVVVKTGDRVEAGQLLLRLESHTAAADLDAASAALGALEGEHRAALARLDRASVQLRAASRERARARVLLEAGLIAHADFEAADAAWHIAQHDRRFAELDVTERRERVGSQQHVVARPRHALETRSIRSPIAGRIADVAVAAGDTVVPAARQIGGSALLVIHDDTGLQAVAHAPARVLTTLAVGQPAWLTLAAFPGERVPGRLVALGLAPVPAATVPGAAEPHYPAVVAIDPVPSARPGQTGTLTIVTAERHNALSIPRHIVSNDPATGTRSVFVADADHARLTPVVLGAADATHVEVLHGLADDAVLVAGPLATLRRLKHGDRVNAR